MAAPSRRRPSQGASRSESSPTIGQPAAGELSTSTLDVGRSMFDVPSPPSPQAVGLTIDELRLLIFDRILESRSVTSKIQNPKSTFVIRHSSFVIRHSSFVIRHAPALRSARSTFLRRRRTLHFNVRCWAFDVRCSLACRHPQHPPLAVRSRSSFSSSSGKAGLHRVVFGKYLSVGAPDNLQNMLPRCPPLPWVINFVTPRK